jgi:hypothetical protein
MAKVHYYKCSLDLYKKYLKENKLQDLSFYYTEDEGTKEKALYLGKLLLSDNGNIHIEQLQTLIQQLNEKVANLEKLQESVQQLNEKVINLEEYAEDIDAFIDDTNLSMAAMQQTLDKKIDKIEGEDIEVGNLISLGENGQLVDSGKKAADFVATTGDQTIAGAKTFKDEVVLNRNEGATVKVETLADGSYSSTPSYTVYDDHRIRASYGEGSELHYKFDDDSTGDAKYADENHNVTIATREFVEAQGYLTSDDISGKFVSSEGYIPYSQEEKDKLANIESGAQANVIEEIEFLGENTSRATSKAVSMEGKKAIIDLSNITVPYANSASALEENASNEILNKALTRAKKQIQGETETTVENCVQNIKKANYAENDATSYAFMENRPFFDYEEIVQKEKYIHIEYDIIDNSWSMLDYFVDNDKGSSPMFNSNFGEFESPENFYQFKNNMIPGVYPDRYKKLADWPAGTKLSVWKDETMEETIFLDFVQDEEEVSKYLKCAEWAFTTTTDDLLNHPDGTVTTSGHRWGVSLYPNGDISQYPRVLELHFPAITKTKTRKISSKYVDLSSILSRLSAIENTLALINLDKNAKQEKPLEQEYALWDPNEANVAYCMDIAQQMSIEVAEEEVKKPAKVKWWKKLANSVGNFFEDIVDDTIDDIKTTFSMAKTIYSLKDSDINLTNVTGDFTRTKWQDGFYKYTINIQLEIDGREVQEEIVITGREAAEEVLKMVITLLLKKYGGEKLAEVAEKVN